MQKKTTNRKRTGKTRKETNSRPRTRKPPAADRAPRNACPGIDCVVTSISDAISADPAIDRIVSKSLPLIRKFTSADAAFLHVRRNNKLMLSGMHPSRARSRCSGRSALRIGECLCGKAAVGSCVFSVDIATDARRTREECLEAGIRSFAALPLTGSGETIGLLSIASYSEADFSCHAEALRAIASQLSVALQGVLLLEQEQRRSAELQQTISSLRGSEAALRLFQSLIAKSGDLIFICEASSSRILYANETAHHRLGYPAGDILKLAITAILRESTAATAGNHSLVRPFPPQDDIRQAECISRDGESFPVEVRRTTANHDGTEYLVIIVRDVTERILSETALQAAVVRSHNAYSKLESVLASIGDLVTIQGRDFRILFQNRAILDFFGNCAGEPCYEAYEKRSAPCDDCALVRVFQDGKRHSSFRSVHAAGGTREFELTASPIHDAAGEIIAVIEIARDVTERCAAERALRDSEERYRVIFESIPHPMFVYDRETLAFLAVNEAAVRCYGFTRDEFAAMTIENIRPADDLPGLRELVNELGTGTSAPRIMRHRKKTGGLMQMEVISHGIIYAGKTARIVLAHDVSARIRADEKLRASETKYRGLYQSMMDGYVLVDMSGRILESNDSYQTMLGYGREKLSRLTYRDITPVKWHAPEQRIIEEQILVRGYSDVYEKEYRKKDGTVFPVELRTFLIRDSGDGPAGMWAIVRDITERKQAEEQLRNLSMLVENTTDFISLIAFDGTISYLNNAAKSLIGFGGPAAGRNVSIFDFLPDTGQGDFLSHIMPAILSEGRWSGEFRLRHLRTGECIPVELSMFTIGGSRTDASPLLAVICRDTRERKDLQAQLLQAQKMEAIGQLAGGIAHDFNNILTVIIGESTMALMDMGPNAPQRPAMEQILLTADRASNLTQSVLSFSSKHVLNPSIVEVNRIIRRVEHLLQRIIGEDIHMQIELPAKSAVILADPPQIEQALLNLATNARDAMPEGGRLLISADVIDIAADKTGHYGVGKAGIYALITVADTGVGMDARTREQAFNPFFTTKREGKGTGLGLAIVHNIVTQHGGSVSLSSEPGEGATFKLFLPCVAGDQLSRESPRRSDALPEGSATILLAEDDSAVRSLVSGLLAKFGYTVITAEDGQDAIDKFLRSRDAVDLLILDIIMPKKNGREVHEELKRLRPGIKALFVSGYSADIFGKSTGIGEELHYLSKPLAPDALLQKIHDILNR